MLLKKEIGKNIQKFRKLNKITQEKLAEMVGVEINSISSIETGKYFPSPENLVKIASSLNVSLADLFTFKKELSNTEYIQEINNYIALLKNNTEKLKSIYNYIKYII